MIYTDLLESHLHDASVSTAHAQGGDDLYPPCLDIVCHISLSN